MGTADRRGVREAAAASSWFARFSRRQWIGASIVGVVGLVVAAALVVVGARALVALDPVREFLAQHPGEYPLPEGAPVGIPAWLGWQHFFNTFLIVLIIRSGRQVRKQQRPVAFWSPRGERRRKLSLTLWFHLALDVLWIANGVTYAALLLLTGQWMKIVPTSWEVFPNAVAAGLQYATLDWPTHDGWVNYNSLQQLFYFTTVFVAAPLAIVTGARLSVFWPRRAERLNRLAPFDATRRLHGWTMVYFVVFIAVHVALVFATGALRNLNHMYAARDAVNGIGFWIFAGSLIVLAAGWVAARPAVLVPLARLFGEVRVTPGSDR